MKPEEQDWEHIYLDEKRRAIIKAAAFSDAGRH